MEMFLIILVLASALVALAAAISALRAWLKMRRTRAALRMHLSSEVARLARRTTELEKSLAALDDQAQALPVRISELQQNLATLRVLTNALGTSLLQAQKILSFTGLRSFLAGPLAEAFRARTKRSNGVAGREQKGEAPHP
jgi:TolA-binding protein